MSDLIKQRIVGVIVVLAVLLIFMPFILHQPKAIKVRKMPNFPTPPSSTIDLQLSPASTSNPVVVNNSPSNKPHILAAQKKEVNTKNMFKTPDAWTVFLVSFSKPNLANNLLLELHKQGFDAYKRQVVSGGKTITRIYVGPNINKYKIDEIRLQLKNKFHLNGLVRKYST